MDIHIYKKKIGKEYTKMLTIIFPWGAKIMGAKIIIYVFFSLLACVIFLHEKEYIWKGY